MQPIFSLRHCLHAISIRQIPQLGHELQNNITIKMQMTLADGIMSSRSIMFRCVVKRMQRMVGEQYTEEVVAWKQ